MRGVAAYLGDPWQRTRQRVRPHTNVRWPYSARELSETSPYVLLWRVESGSVEGEARIPQNASRGVGISASPSFILTATTAIVTGQAGRVLHVFGYTTTMDSEIRNEGKP